MSLLYKWYTAWIFFLSCFFVFPSLVYASSVRINEIVSHGSSGDWVELYTSSQEEVDLSGWKIEDSTGVMKTLDEGTKIASSSSFFHLSVTNRLNNSGDKVIIKDATGSVVDQIEYTFDPGMDIPFGRFPDGSDTWNVLSTATPNGPNSSSAPTYTPTPTTSPTTIPTSKPSKSAATNTPKPVSTIAPSHTVVDISKIFVPTLTLKLSAPLSSVSSSQAVLGKTEQIENLIPTAHVIAAGEQTKTPSFLVPVVSIIGGVLLFISSVIAGIRVRRSHSNT